MNLHLIRRSTSNSHAVESFQNACTKLNCNLTVINSSNFDFSEEWELTENDAIYCLSDDQTSRMVELSLINDRTRHFYDGYRTAITKKYDADDITNYLLQRRAGLPVIESVIAITSDKEMLENIVKKLGGYPIIIKAIGGSKGHGVIKVDSEESLNSLDDYLVTKKDRFILKKFIPEAKSIRVAVIGDNAVAAMEHAPIHGDFRSNSGKGDHQSKIHELTEEEASLAVSAVNCLGLKLGGVDLSIDEQGGVYITEVNMPFAFKRLEAITGVSVSEKMVEFLLDFQKVMDA